MVEQLSPSERHTRILLLEKTDLFKKVQRVTKKHQQRDEIIELLQIEFENVKTMRSTLTNAALLKSKLLNKLFKFEERLRDKATQLDITEQSKKIDTRFFNLMKEKAENKKIVAETSRRIDENKLKIIP